MATISSTFRAQNVRYSSQGPRMVAQSCCNRRANSYLKYNAGNRGRQLTLVHSKRATDEDEKLIEEMKRAAEKGDLLESSVADVAVKVLAVAAAVGVVVVLAYLGQPVIENTVAAFPRAAA